MRRRQDWAVSRALLAHAQPGSGTTHSLSHSHSHAALAIAHGAVGVGVDLEVARERDYLRIAEFAFAADEATDLAALHVDQHAERFYLLWTLKEAFAKALRWPLLESLRECVFTHRDGNWSARIPTTLAWTALAFRPRADLYLSIVLLGACDSEQYVTQHEWPHATTKPWPTLITMSVESIALSDHVP